MSSTLKTHQNLTGYGPKTLPLVKSVKTMEDKQGPPYLNDTNWISWQAAITGSFYLKNLDCHLEEPVAESELKKLTTETEEAFNARKKLALRGANMARAVMRMYMSEKYQQLTEHCTTAYETFKLLKGHFVASAKNKIAINIEKLALLSKDPPPVEELALKIRSYAANIGDVRVNTDQFMVAYFCALIPSELSDLRVSMQSSETSKLSMSDATELVKNELDRKKQKSTVAAQFKFQKRNEKTTKYERSDKSEKDVLICTYCAKTRHTAENCFFKKRAEKLNNERKVKMSAIRMSSCAISSQTERENFYLDSGAETHSVNNANGFDILQESHNIKLESAHGQEIEVSGVGVYGIRAGTGVTFKLRDCVYAPSLIANFLSAGRLNDHGMDILLSRDGTCRVFDDDGVVATGVKRNGMYLLDMRSRSCESLRTATIQKKKRTAMEWHRTLGHMNFRDLLRLSDKLKIDETTEIPDCKCCLLAKMAKKPYKKDKNRPKIESTEPLERIHTDLSGIIRTPAVGGFKYFLTFIDDYTRYVTVYLLKSKEEVFEKFTEFKNLVENQFGKKIKKIRSDNGTEYTNHRFQQLLKDSGILMEPTHVDSPQENGVAERMNRTIGNGVRSVLIDSNMPSRPFAVRHVVQLRNASPNSSLDFKIPFELWNRKVFDYGRVQRFGCTAVAKKIEITGKIADKGCECKLLCLSTDRSGYTLLRKSDNNVFDSRDVVFLCEEDPVVQKDEEALSNLFEMDNPNDEFPPNNAENCSNQFENAAAFNTEPDSAFAMGTTTTETVQAIDTECACPDDPAATEEATTPQITETTALPQTVENNVGFSTNDQPVNTFQAGEERLFTARQLQEFMDENPGATLRRLVGGSTKVKTGRPGCPANAYRYKINYINPNKEVTDALSGSESSNWKKALDEEYAALIKNETWILVQRPKDAKLIKTRWILTKKQEGESTRYKARLVAKGYNQQHGIDFDETYAPVLRSSSIKVLLSHALNNHLEIHHVDVKNAYLNAPLNEVVYVEQPFGYEGENRNLVCRLSKAMYGLKQAARCWNDFLTKLLKKLGLKQFVSEKCIYASKGNELIVGAYVDDLLVISHSKHIVENFKRRLAELIKITDKGPLTRFLGMDVIRTNETIKLSQKSHVDDLLIANELFDANGVKTPISTGTVFERMQNDLSCINPKAYQRLVGSLMYIAGCTRPDILYAANRLGQYMSDPLEKHMTAAKRVLRYLKQTRTAGLQFKPNNDNELVIFADADFANDETCRSVSGVTVFYGGNLIEWSSNRQQLVALSTCEAELNAIKDGCTNAIYYRELIGELMDQEMDSAITVYNDNLPTNDIIENGGKHSRTKHYKIRINFVQDLVRENVIDVKHMNTEEMIADVFTKPLPESQHVYLLTKAGMFF